MEPHIGRLAFNVAILILMLTLIPLPFLEKDSPEFVADILALIFDLVFLFFVTYEVRREAKIP